MESMVQAASAAQPTPPASPRRVGFFGGSFDPPHYGHLAVARAARDALRLDHVLFAPVGAQPLKPHGSTAGFNDRLAMTELAIADETSFGISLLDAPTAAGRPNYTLHTLRQLQSDMANAELYCLMGADSFVSLRRWYGAAEIPFAASLVVASRPGEDIRDLEQSVPAGLTIKVAEPPVESADASIQLVCWTLRNGQGRTAALYILPGLDVEISATDIRGQIKTGIPADPARPLIPAAVAEYIREHGLYR